MTRDATPTTVPPPPGVESADPSEDTVIVVRVPNWVGDAVLAMPAVAAVVERFAGREIVVVARAHIAPLFTGFTGVTDVVRITTRGLSRFAESRRKLDGVSPAIGVVFPHSLGAAGELAGGGVGPIWGYGGLSRRLAVDVALPRRWIAGRHRWETFARLAAAFTGRPVAERYPVPVGAGDVAAADALFDDVDRSRPVIGLVPGAHATSRRWPVERFAETASRLGREGASVVVFGSDADRPLAEAITRSADPAPVDHAGQTTLPVLAECFRRLDYLVTNDTGPMHLAAAVGTPLLDLCGAANERVTAPRGARCDVMIHPVFCRPCVKNRCAYNLECLRGIPVDRVVSHVFSACPVSA